MRPANKVTENEKKERKYNFSKCTFNAGIEHGAWHAEIVVHFITSLDESFSAPILHNPHPA